MVSINSRKFYRPNNTGHLSNFAGICCMVKIFGVYKLALWTYNLTVRWIRFILQYIFMDSTKTPWSWGLIGHYWLGGRGIKPCSTILLLWKKKEESTNFWIFEFSRIFEKQAGGRESNLWRRWRRRDLIHDLWKHRHLRPTICLELSGVTARAHGSTYILFIYVLVAH